jgi:pyruvate kinase
MKQIGFVEELCLKDQMAQIILENKNRIAIPLCLLPSDVNEEDFILMEDGKVTKDPDNLQKKMLMKKIIQDQIDSSRKKN